MTISVSASRTGTGLSQRDRDLYALVSPTPDHRYECDVHLHRRGDWVDSNDADLRQLGGCLEVNPDFQRGHVWTAMQRTKFVEALIRGQAEARILFNCPGYSGGSRASGDIAAHTMQCIDGLQRLTCLIDYAAGKVPVFGGLNVADFAQSPFDAKRLRARIRVYELPSRADLLRFYLQLNTGGTVHTAEELDRVRGLLNDAMKPETPARRRKPS